MIVLELVVTEQTPMKLAIVLACFTPFSRDVEAIVEVVVIGYATRHLRQQIHTVAVLPKTFVVMTHQEPGPREIQTAIQVM